MADDDIKNPIGDVPEAELKKYAAMIKALRRETDQLTDAMRRAADPQKKFEANFGRINKRAAETEKQFDSLSDVLKDQIKAITHAAAEVGSLQSQFKDVGSSVTGFMNKLKDTISVSNIYNRMLTEMREGQKSFSSSVHATTDAMGQASAQSQRFVDTIHDAYADARDIAAEYGVQIEGVRKINDGLMESFGSQMAVQGNMSAAMRRTTKDVFHFSRFMGVDAAKSIELMQTQMKNSLRTFSESRKAMMAVAMEADKLSQGMKTLGKRFMQTGHLGRKEFVGILSEIGGQFETGMFQIESYAGAVRAAVVGATQSAGGLVTGQEQAVIAKGIGGFLASLQQFDSSWGIRLGQMVEGMEGRLETIQDETLRSRIKQTLKMTKDDPDIQRWGSLLSAVRGSGEGTAMIVDLMKSEASPELLRELIRKYTKGDPRLARMAEQLITNNTIQDALRKDTLNQGKKNSKDQVGVFSEKIEQLMKKGTDPQKAMYKVAKEAHKIQQKILGFMEKNPFLSATVAAAVQAFFLRAVVFGVPVSIKTFGSTGAGGKTGAAGAAGSVKAAAGAALLMKTFSDALAGIAEGKTTGGKIALGLKGITGITAGQQLDKYLGKTLGLGEDAGAPKLGGRDVSASGYLGRKVLPTLIARTKEEDEAIKRTEAQMTRVRGVWTKAHVTRLKKSEEQVAKARKNWDKLNPAERKKIEQLEISIKLMKRRNDLHKKAIKADLARSKFLDKTLEGRKEMIASFITRKQAGADSSIHGVTLEDSKKRLMETGKSITGKKDIAAFKSLLDDPAMVRRKFTGAGRTDMLAMMRDKKFMAKLMSQVGTGTDMSVVRGKPPVTPKPAVADTAPKFTKKTVAGLSDATGFGPMAMARRLATARMGLPQQATKDLKAGRQTNVSVSTGVKPTEGGAPAATKATPDATGAMEFPVHQAGQAFVRVDIKSLAIETERAKKAMEPADPFGGYMG